MQGWLALALVVGGCREEVPPSEPRAEPELRSVGDAAAGQEATAERPPSTTVEAEPEAEAEAEPEPIAAPEGCSIVVDDTTATLRIDGVPVSDLRLETLRPILGEPDRIETVRSRQRYEEFGKRRGGSPTSTLVDVTDRHLVYDELGLVVRTHARGRPGGSVTGDPVVLLVFLPPARSFTNTAAPSVVPKERGGCVLGLRGRWLDPEADLVPEGVGYRTDSLAVLGRDFGPTSIGGEIDGLYSKSGSPWVRIYLDDPSTQRASYLEIRP